MIPTRRKFLVGRVQYRLLALSLTYVAITVAAFFLVFFVPLIVKLQSDAVSEAERTRAADLNRPA